VEFFVGWAIALIFIVTKSNVSMAGGPSEGVTSAATMKRAATTCPPSLARMRKLDNDAACEIAIADGVFDGAPSSSSTSDIDVRSPEMAHFLAQNLIAPCGLFSEN
jgi:hypothetical protein